MKVSVWAAFAAMLLLSAETHARGEREIVQVLAAKVRAQLQPAMPDQPPNVLIKNLDGAARQSIETIVETEPVVVPAQPMLTFAKSESSSATQPYDVTVYTASWCGPCESMKRRDGAGNDRVHLTWIQSAPPAGIPELYPTLCWRDAGGELRYTQGAITLDKLLVVIERNNPRREPSPQATGAGGVFRGCEAIQTMISRWKQHVGEDHPIEFRWDRTGAQQMDLLHGEDWTALQVFGKYGHMSISGDVPGLSVESLGVGYRLDEAGHLTIDPDAVTITLPDGSRQAPALTVGACGIDPLSVAWGVFSLVRVLYQILNPQVDLMLGGNVECTAVLHDETLSIHFSECPGIRVQAWLEWKLEVEQVTVSPTNIHVQFKDQSRSWFKIKSRDFPVN